MDNRICPNCGSQLVVQNGKYFCPTCGTEFAIDWGKDDVARAAAMTEQERMQARLQRNQAINQTQAALNQQAAANQRRRQTAKAFRPIIAMGITFGVIFLCFSIGGFLFQSCGVFLLHKNMKNLGNNALIDVTYEGKNVKYDVSASDIEGDKEFLEGIIGSSLYYMKYDAIYSDSEYLGDSYVHLQKTGNFEFDSCYVIHEDGESQLWVLYAAEYRIEETGEMITAYRPISFRNLGVREDGVMNGNLTPYALAGDNSTMIGYLDRDLMLNDCIFNKDYEEVKIPASVFAAQDQE